ncbi:MAG: DNA polymerase I, partial [Halobacteriaceae archaeon]
VGAIDPERLVITNRVSKPLEEYSQSTRNVAALERRLAQGIEAHPGQDVEYVVVDDFKTSRERVQLATKKVDQYDGDFYRDRAIAAAVSVITPIGYTGADIQDFLSCFRSVGISSFQPID